MQTLLIFKKICILKHAEIFIDHRISTKLATEDITIVYKKNSN